MNRSAFSQGQTSSMFRSQQSTGKSTSQPTAKGFWAKLRLFVFKLKGLTFKGYRNSRKLIWVSSTAFIFLMAPFLFAHFQELQDELVRISRQGAEGIMAGQGTSSY